MTRVLIRSGKFDVNRPCLSSHFDWGEDYTSRERTALMAACENGNEGCVRELLAHDGITATHTDAYGVTALHLAAEANSPECVRALLRSPPRVGAGSIVNAVAFTMHSMPLGAEHWAMHQAPVTGYGTPIQIAAQMGHWECAKALLQADGVDLEHTFSFMSPRPTTPTLGHDENHGRVRGRTVLHHAALLDNAEMTHLLLAKGSCRFAKDSRGNTAAAYATYGRHPTSNPGNASQDPAFRAIRVPQVLATGVDYWQRRLHSLHSRPMQELVTTVLLVKRRMDQGPGASIARALSPAQPETLAQVGRATPRKEPDAGAAAVAPLPNMPVEIWREVFGFMRSADFHLPPQEVRAAQCGTA